AGVVPRDPTARLTHPKLGRKLPNALSEHDVEALLAAPDPRSPIGLRDRAMLELLYATGLRVSELVELKSTGVNARQGVVRVVGKGGKERLGPVGGEGPASLGRRLEDPAGVRVDGARAT